jgi:hypothetical protein
MNASSSIRQVTTVDPQVCIVGPSVFNDYVNGFFPPLQLQITKLHRCTTGSKALILQLQPLCNVRTFNNSHSVCVIAPYVCEYIQGYYKFKTPPL